LGWPFTAVLAQTHASQATRDAVLFCLRPFAFVDEQLARKVLPHPTYRFASRRSR
jgi:hypothetical protein